MSQTALVDILGRCLPPGLSDWSGQALGRKRFGRRPRLNGLVLGRSLLGGDLRENGARRCVRGFDDDRGLRWR